jgi:hypothetical protein
LREIKAIALAMRNGTALAQGMAALPRPDVLVPHHMEVASLPFEQACVVWKWLVSAPLLCCAMTRCIERSRASGVVLGRAAHELLDSAGPRNVMQ